MRRAGWPSCDDRDAAGLLRTDKKSRPPPEEAAETLTNFESVESVLPVIQLLGDSNGGSPEAGVKSLLALHLVVLCASDGLIAQDHDDGQVNEGHQPHEDVADVLCDRELQ